MDEDFLVLVGNGLECHRTPARESGGIERELKGDAPVFLLCGERLFSSDLLSVDQEGLSGRFVHEDAARLVLLARDEVRVNNFVCDCDALCDPCRMAAGRLVLGRRPSVREVDGLVRVVDVLVVEHDVAAKPDRLKYDRIFSLQCRCVEGELHLVCAV